MKELEVTDVWLSRLGVSDWATVMSLCVTYNDDDDDADYYYYYYYCDVVKCR